MPAVLCKSLKKSCNRLASWRQTHFLGYPGYPKNKQCIFHKLDYRAPSQLKALHLQLSSPTNSYNHCTFSPKSSLFSENEVHVSQLSSSLSASDNGKTKSNSWTRKLQWSISTDFPQNTYHGRCSCDNAAKCMKPFHK